MVGTVPVRAVCRMMTFPRELGTNLGICPPFCGHIFFSEPSAKSVRGRAHGVPVVRKRELRSLDYFYSRL
jgi:hypothetical protein